MRTALFLLSAVSLLAACSDDANSTAPRSLATNAPVAAPTNAQTSPVSAAAAGKPAAGTTVTYLTSPETNIDGITFISGVAWITCPAGSSVVGGGYEFTWGVINARIGYNGPVGNNIWKVVVYAAGASQIKFKAMGTCVQ